MRRLPSSDIKGVNAVYPAITENLRVEQEIRTIVAEHGRLSVDVASLDREASLYQAGLTSHASVNFMLALEDHFGIEFPERMLRRRTFETIAAIQAAVEELTGRNASTV